MMHVWAQNDGMPRMNHYDLSPPNNVACLTDSSVIRCLEFPEAAFQRQRHRSWQDLEDRRGREFASRIQLDEVVYSANFPDTWDWVERAFDRSRTYITVGLHPHVCSEFIPEKVMRRSAQLLRDPAVLGVGEVGLDYYHHSQERERSLQRSYLHTLLPQVASTSKPLVIHCREHSAESSQARKDLLTILKNHLTYSTNHVYLHRFSRLRFCVCV